MTIALWEMIEDDFALVEKQKEMVASKEFWNDRPKGWGKREVMEHEEAKSA